MARYVDVTFEGAYLPGTQGSAGGPACYVPRTTMTLMLDNDGTWRLMPPYPPYWRYLAPDWPGGKYSETATRWFQLDSRDGSQQVFELRGVEKLHGPAFGYLAGQKFLLQGEWQPSARPLPHSWVGVMVKGSAGAVYQGEVGIGAVVSLNDASHGAGFRAWSNRLGATAGFSGGAALVLATGFKSPGEFDGFQSSGADWTLSIGAKASALIKGGKLERLLHTLEAFEDGLDRVNDLFKKLKESELSKELHTVGKGVYQRLLVNDDTKAITAIDIPVLGAGAEAGIYYAWTTTRVLSQW